MLITKKLLGQKLKDKNKQVEIRNIMSLLDKFFNENTKHKDGNIQEPENEMLIYQISLIMRYLNKIL